MDTVEGKFEQRALNKEGVVIEHERERQATVQTKVRAHRIISKEKLYLKLLTSGLPRASSASNFLKEVLGLLEQ
jgi:hypothetical protein